MASAQAQKPEPIAPCECLLYLLKNERGKVGLRARCDTHRLFAMVTEDRSIAVQREPFRVPAERTS